ncbi:monooxygenase [Sporothrix curviconia]|uniref:Monooxygenase n=1 Tax=Sporothrix curviconia TaxID=1260050 RepID=A0ABP0BAY4_9PEZI
MTDTTRRDPRRLNIDRVAVIGAGACGLAAARYLQAEQAFSLIQVFDQRSVAGGLWNYTPLTDGQPQEDAVVSPVYDLLETNIPHTLMNYTNEPFPSGSALFPEHAVVKSYLQRCAEPVAPLLSLQTEVLSVRKKSNGNGWTVETRHIPSGTTTATPFDAVVVANGHYSDPFVPAIPGLDSFRQKHPGVVSHAKFYRRAEDSADKKVIVVGNSASGIDISAQIATVCRTPVLVSEKEKDTSATVNPIAATAEPSSTIRNVPEIVEFLADDASSSASVRMADGTIETAVDAVVFCTGYLYTFPFLPASYTAADGSYVPGLYEQLLRADDPTLAFLGIPQRVVPFPVAEAQGAWVARLYSGRCALPPAAELVASPLNGRGAHNLGFPQDVAYINRLHDRSLQADRVPGLANDGVGKMPPYWGPEQAWVRERFPAIKVAFRALGEERQGIGRLEQLGFDFAAWEKEQQEGKEQKTIE